MLRVIATFVTQWKGIYFLRRNSLLNIRACFIDFGSYLKFNVLFKLTWTLTKFDTKTISETINIIHICNGKIVCNNRSLYEYKKQSIINISIIESPYSGIKNTSTFQQFTCFWFGTTKIIEYD